ncbi:MAG: peptidoglycan DD-metalloendopeptidase family protein [Acidobacteria bacterium]|nr:peptidoglycan DD-metalloendopeptidase family protein [Acidobacteriota bacterium]
MTSQPVALFRVAAFGQNPNQQDKEEKGLSRQTIPDYQMPNVAEIMSEGKKAKQTELPPPPFRPSTECGFRDVACREKKAKEKIGQSVTPANAATANQIALQAVPAPSQSEASAITPTGWRQRLRKWVGALTGLSQPTVALTGTQSFMPSHKAVATNMTSAAASVACPPATMNSLKEALTDPHYRMGSEGEDLFSGNYHMSLPLVSLSGRAGLDLTVSLHYNSLTYTRYVQSGVQKIGFDTSYYASLTPGFRLGFPELDGPITLRGNSSYIVILPSGRRIEMRNVATNKYETVDSSNLYLITYPTATPKPKATLFSPDGVQYRYTAGNDNVLRCDKVMDRNGNYLTINYVTLANNMIVIGTIVDTLGRTIQFNYDSNFHLLSITQNWANGQTFYWAIFYYGTTTLQTNFEPCLIPDAFTNNQSIPVINTVVTSDGARHVFNYNAWGQIAQHHTHGEANNLRSSMIYAFPPNTTALGDCPIFTQRNDYIANWAGANWTGTVTNYFYVDPAETYGQIVLPNGVVHREKYGTVGAERGLLKRTEILDGSVRRQFTENIWQSDGAAGTFPPLRPRIVETKVCDDRNGNNTYESSADKMRRTTISYFTPTSLLHTNIRLPEYIREYNEGDTAATVYRTRRLNYLATDQYINSDRRIVGLVSQDTLFSGNIATMVAQTDYLYDYNITESGFVFLQDHSTNTTAVSQHEGHSTNTGYQVGGQHRRGNLTKVMRYSVSGGTASAPITYKTGYYSTGTVACSTEGIDTHKTSVFYNDAFTAGVTTAPSPATYAYPTRVQDADTFSSMAKYHYDHGGVTEQIDPKAYLANPTNPQTKGVTLYDTKGRVERTKVVKDGADYSYTRNVYSTDHNWAQTLTTVNSLSIETYVMHTLDGIGRERITVTEHPGSLGGAKLQYVAFDIMGRVYESSNPTEVNSANWAPYGDDSNGYKYRSQAYDWKGRPTTTTNQDLTTRSLSYDGCGCSGAQTMTALDEVGRKQVSYYDVFGRMTKTEAYNWNGSAATTLYSATTTDYDVRDLTLSVKTYNCATNTANCLAGVYQEATTSYDGYGRLATSRLPEYNTGAQTSYSYAADDKIVTATDPRGVVTTYGYGPFNKAGNASSPNNRGLLSSITYSNLPASVTPTLPITFGYDENGQRKWMDDEPGSANYVYDSLSRMTQETRTFIGHPTAYTLDYSYNLAGELTTFSNSTGKTINYQYDKVGRLSGATTAGFAGISSLFSGVTYRAWGGITHVNYGNGLSKDLIYDNRMNTKASIMPGKMNLGYTYHNDGRVNQVSDYLYTSNYRLINYDHLGRLSAAASGIFNETFQSDVWGNMTGRYNSASTPQNYTATYLNNRNTSTTWAYDAAGNNTRTDNLYTYYNASGNISKTCKGTCPNQTEYYYDGNGQEVKTVFAVGGSPFSTTYEIRSSVLGGKLVIDNIVGTISTHAYAGEEYLAKGDPTSTEWTHNDFFSSKRLRVNSSGSTLVAIEFDPLGTAAEVQDLTQNNVDDIELVRREFGSLAEALGHGCYLDGAIAECGTVFRLLAQGAAVPGLGKDAFTDFKRQRGGTDPRPNQKPNQPIFIPFGFSGGFFVTRQTHGEGVPQIEGGELGGSGSDFFDTDFILGGLQPNQWQLTIPPLPSNQWRLTIPPLAKKQPCDVVNPITGQPGFTPTPRGVQGNLRPGVGGQGHYLARRNGGRQHQGIDINGHMASPIYASHSGTIVRADNNAGGYGKLIEIRGDNGVTTRYAHNTLNLFPLGNYVPAGRVIGLLGQTGNAGGQPLTEAHVHFEVFINGRRGNPATFLNLSCAWQLNLP